MTRVFKLLPDSLDFRLHSVNQGLAGAFRSHDSGDVQNVVVNVGQ